MALGGLPTGSITAKEIHMVTGIRVYKGLISRVSDWKERGREVFYLINKCHCSQLG